jgi:Glutathione S-transferase, N-terminal domain
MPDSQIDPAPELTHANTVRTVRLYVCYGTFGGDHHACARAYNALRAAGHQPEIVRTFGCYGTDRFFARRRKVKDLTGNYKVPTLVLDDGTIVDESQMIAEWATANPA